MKIKLIANPVAGRHAAGKIREIERRLAGLGAKVEVALTEYAGHAEVLARDCRGFDRLVAAGGDGTVNEVINGMMPRPVPLAVIPLGTANILALETGLPADLAGQCENAVQGGVRQITLGRAGRRYFVLMAGAGLDAEVVRRVNLRTKRWLGKGAYLLSALRVFSHPTAVVALKSADWRMADLGGVIVCNGRMYGGSFILAPQASLFSPTLQIIALPRCAPFGLFSLIIRSFLRGGVGPDVKIFTAASIEIAGEAALQLDGDIAGMLPCKITSCPAALPLVTVTPK